MIIHVVKPGDSVYAIARRYGVPASQLIRDNRLENPEQLVVGQALVIPTDTVTHTVARGDTLYSLSRAYNVPLSRILNANPQITNPSLIRPGQSVAIPLGESRQGVIDVNGYAFPSINRQVLDDTLPFLTFLSIFSYQVRPDGSLSTIGDEPLIDAARDVNVGPFMVITNIEEGASFSSDLAHDILASEQVQNVLLDNVVRTMREKNYYGLDIDFEYVYPEDRELFIAFVRKVSERMRALGYSLSIALAPKISATQRGVLYEAHDYQALGRLVDHVILMTYEWGYTYGPAMAVAPLNQVRRVLDYAVTAIDSKKILLGMPNYGYDWTLPFVRGSAARSLSNTAAVDLARRVGAHIQFDTVSAAPYFRYYDEQRKQHEVWFDDARSIQARLRLISQYQLGGASYWTINRFFPQNWIILESMYTIRKI